MSVRLRPATESDLPRLIEIETALFPDSPWSEPALAMELALPGRSYLVLEEDGWIAGYGGVWVAETAEIMTIGVLPARQGHGLGRHLLEALLVKAIQGGSREVFLEVRVDNEPAIGLYRAMGFQSVAIRKRYYQPSDVDALVMKMELSDGLERGLAGPAPGE